MAEKRKRQLTNWLSAFLEWTKPRSETPESMLKWAGLFALSAVTRRRVFWPKSLLGGYEIFPNLYVVFVGDPAVVRKSTTIGFAEELLTNTALSGPDVITFGGDVTSHSKLLGAINDSPDKSVAVVSGEFSSLIQTSPEAMYELLTDIFDNKTKLQWNTWAHGTNLIEKPVINLIAATTPKWISKQPEEYFVGGGFASRILFVYEEEPRQKEIYYDSISQTWVKDLETKLANDLKYIAGLGGELTHDTRETYHHIKNWYKRTDARSEDSRLSGYKGRKHVHAHKVAALLSIAERDDRKITAKHWDEALEMLDYVEKRMSKAFSTLGTNPFSLMMENIVDYLDGKGEVGIRQLAGRFYRDGVTLDQLKSALAFLCTTGKIKAKGTLDPTYHIPK